MAEDKSRAKAMEAVEAIFERYDLITRRTSSPLFDKHIMSGLHIETASSDGSVTFSLTIGPEYGNLNGVLHGGAAALIFDMCTTAALGPVARPGFWDFLGGVTRSLNISYLKAIPIGTKILIRSKVAQVGRTLALIRGEMVSEDGKTVYCTCEQHKVRVPTREEHRAVRVRWDEGWEKEEGREKEGGKREKAKL